MEQRSWATEMSRSLQASKDTGKATKQSPEHHSQGNIVGGGAFHSPTGVLIRSRSKLLFRCSETLLPFLERAESWVFSLRISGCWVLGSYIPGRELRATLLSVFIFSTMML